MRKGLTLLLTFILLIGVTSVVFADHDSDDNSSNDSPDTDQIEDTSTNRDDDNSGSGSNDDDDDEDKFRERIRDEIKDEREREFKYEYRDGSGERIKIEIKERMKDGVLERRIKYDLRSRVDGIEIRTKLELREFFNNETNESFFDVDLSDGNITRIRMMPGRINQIAIKRLKNQNFSVELKEIRHKNIPRIVYILQSNHSGRFLGLFKIKARYEATIDSETGEELEFKSPWWAFLIVGDAPDKPGNGGNETDDDDGNETDNDNNQTDTNQTGNGDDNNQTDTNQTGNGDDNNQTDTNQTNSTA